MAGSDFSDATKEQARRLSFFKCCYCMRITAIGLKSAHSYGKRGIIGMKLSNVDMLRSPSIKSKSSTLCGVTFTRCRTNFVC